MCAQGGHDSLLFRRTAEDGVTLLPLVMRGSMRRVFTRPPQMMADAGTIGKKGR